MVTTYQGTIHNGQIHFDDPPELPEGAQVIVTVVTEDQQADMPVGMTGAQILESGIVGMWADRDDITDSAAFAEQLRRNAERRGGDD
jgi:hypothetical protein